MILDDLKLISDSNIICKTIYRAITEPIRLDRGPLLQFKRISDA